MLAWHAPVSCNMSHVTRWCVHVSTHITMLTDRRTVKASKLHFLTHLVAVCRLALADLDQLPEPDSAACVCQHQSSSGAHPYFPQPF